MNARDTTRYWDEIGQEWTDRHPDRLWRAHSDAVYATLLARWLPAGPLGRVLKTDLFDEAVADGLYPVLGHGADTVVGIDVAAPVATAACGRYPQLRGIIGDTRCLPFDDGVFDVVISLSSLDHFPSQNDLRQALAELHRVLAHAGQLIITLDNASNPVVALRNALPHRLLRRVGLVPYEMGATCRASGLVALLKSCGFDVAKVGFVVHCPRVIAVLAARLVDRIGSRRLRLQLLRILRACERLEGLPTHSVTGYYTAVAARKR